MTRPFYNVIAELGLTRALTMADFCNVKTVWTIENHLQTSSHAALPSFKIAVLSIKVFQKLGQGCQRAGNAVSI